MTDSPFFEGPYRRLVNTAAEQKNSIHDDAQAQRLGFRGGFVPGSIVGTAAMPAIVAAFGKEWMEGGWYSFTFVSPVYIDDEVHEVARRTGDGIAIQVLDRSGRLCCNGRAGLGATIPWDPAEDATPGAEGVLPEALAAMPEVALQTLYINLFELIRHLPGRDDAFASIPLADMLRDSK